MYRMFAWACVVRGEAMPCATRHDICYAKPFGVIPAQVLAAQHVAPRGGAGGGDPAGDRVKCDLPTVEFFNILGPLAVLWVGVDSGWVVDGSG